VVNYKKEIDKLLTTLFPITRSITGDGNRETLRLLQEIIPLNIKEYPTGTKVYDWIIPEEWSIKDAWIKNSKGRKIIDFQKSNIHILNYSIPINKRIKFDELKEHLYYKKEIPYTIPNRTSYYKKNWGFCLSYNDYKEYFNENEEYEVFIDSEFKEGSLSIGDLVIEGASKKEYLISTYICHPSLANDNLSGVVLTTFLAKELLKKKRNFSYRIVFAPETIGAIAYCANHEAIMKDIDSGFVITTVGGPGKLGYKQSFDENNSINRIIEKVFHENNIEFITYPFMDIGSDERQYSSIAFRINVATICKDKYYEYDYYHTSHDNLDFVKPEYINETLNIYLQAIEKIDKSIVYENMFPHCEVMLSKHDLYPNISGDYIPNTGIRESELMCRLLIYCDGKKDLFEISQKLNIAIEDLYTVAKKLESKNIFKRVS
jgi:aminopeptidase-like protein